MRRRRSGARRGQARDDENAPLHSPKLTQRRAHPAVVNSAPAGERKLTRVRRGHVEKTRGHKLGNPTGHLKYRYGIPYFGIRGVSVKPRQQKEAAPQLVRIRSTAV